MTSQIHLPDSLSLSNSIIIPHNYLPRPYQLPFWQTMETGKIRNAVMVWHRRSGKDKTALNFLISKMYPENGGRIGTYFHLFPTYAQGKKVIWDGIDKKGFKVRDHFPPSEVRRTNDTEMQVELRNGSIYQVIGTDKIDSIVGTNPVGCIYSEFALQNPRAYDMLSPILLENEGWNIFNFTPRGHNHAEGLYRMAKANPQRWYSSLFTVDDTKDETGKPVVTKEQIEEERARLLAQGKSEADVETFIQQEYYCSFEGYLEGSYYAEQLKRARDEYRIHSVPWTTGLPVYTFWDIGVGDATAIWFAQRSGRRIHFIDYYENTGQQIAHYAKHLRSLPYVFGGHYWPHDGKNRDWSNVGSLNRQDTARTLGIWPVHVIPRGDVDDGIDEARRLFPTCYFDSRKCAKGLDALAAYRKAYDDKAKDFKPKPVHDWASHGADAFRTFSTSRWWGDIYNVNRQPTYIPRSWMSA